MAGLPPGVCIQNWYSAVAPAAHVELAVQVMLVPTLWGEAGLGSNTTAEHDKTGVGVEVGSGVPVGATVDVALALAVGVEVPSGVEVGVELATGVEVAVEVGTAVAVGVEDGVELGSAVDVGVDVDVEVATGVEVEVGSAVAVGVDVDVDVDVEVATGVEVEVGSAVAVGVELGTGVGVTVGVGVLVTATFSVYICELYACISTLEPTARTVAHHWYVPAGPALVFHASVLLVAYARTMVGLPPGDRIQNWYSGLAPVAQVELAVQTILVPMRWGDERLGAKATDVQSGAACATTSLATRLDASTEAINADITKRR